MLVKPEVSETTQRFLDWADGDEAALRGMAAAFIRREREQHTLQPTALVHEVYLKLVDVRKAGWKGKAHSTAPALRSCVASSSTRPEGN
jgi:hypothetical protein